MSKNVYPDGVKFIRRLDKGYKEGGFSFPRSHIELTDKVVDDFKMRNTLTRLAEALTMQFRKENKKVRGVIIGSVGFEFVYQSKAV